MNCDDAREQLSDVAGGELDGARAEEVRAHAAACASCGRELEKLEATVGLLRRAGAEPLPDDFSMSLHRALVAAGPPRPSWLDGVRAAIALRPFTFAASAAALAAMVAVGGTIALVRHTNAPSPIAAYKVPESKV